MTPHSPARELAKTIYFQGKWSGTNQNQKIWSVAWIESLIESALNEAINNKQEWMAMKPWIDKAKKEAYLDAAKTIMESGFNDSFSTVNMKRHTEALAGIIRQKAEGL